MSIGLNDATQSYVTSIVQGNNRKRGRGSASNQGTIFLGYTPVDTDESQASTSRAASAASAAEEEGSQLPANDSEIFYQKLKYGAGDVWISSYESAYAEINQSKLASSSVALQAYNEVLGMERRERLRQMFAFSAYA